MAQKFSAELGLNAGDLGLLAGAYFFGFAAMQLPLGNALDRFGPRRVLLAFIAVAVLGCAAFAMARSFVGLTISRGFSREEPRGVGDVIALESNTFRGQADLEVTSRMRLLITSSATRQERAVGSTLWQTTVSAGAAYRF